MAGLAWSNEEDNILREYYYSTDKESMLHLLPGRTWDAIKIRAGKHNIERGSFMLCTGDPSSLLDETSEAYYWAGFLAADAHFTKDGRLKLSVSSVDDGHIRKLASFMHTKVQTYETTSCTSVKHPAIKQLMEKFSFSNTKTYSPCDLSNLNHEQLMSFLIGYIDGDGCITKQTGRVDCRITIKCHSSWEENLNTMVGSAYIKAGLSPIRARIDRSGYAVINIGNSLVVQYLHQFANKHKLPVIHRKWDKVDITYVSKQTTGKQRVYLVRALLADGLSKSDIAIALNIGNSSVTQIIQRNNIPAYKGKNKKGGIR